MTRSRKIDPAILEREYIYDTSNPPISITGLAEKYGLARSGVADKATNGQWFEKRQEFRRQLGEKVVENMTDKWAGMHAALQEKMLTTAIKSLEAYETALEAGTVKMSSRDAQGWMAVIRTLIGDMAVASKDKELIDPGNVILPADVYRDHIGDIKQLLAQTEGSDDDASPDGDGD